MPVQEIDHNLDATLQRSNALFQRLDADLVPAARSSLDAAREAFRAADETLDQASPLQSDARQALTELRGMLASLNALADFLERHPEAFIWGKRRD
ncbi:hypothetical protein [Paraburkholderia tagetis]|uniref:Uncharacterized protein n=1 Tax=Paraburkholderia tagetis TaxID=2913261 RepID=A0A9X1RPZ5_9BURK|nr:hypothetical protein [Paraburkholderia tagetis]MCG5073173.1 hypothetical protein [Paraburkholderia tagetis]